VMVVAEGLNVFNHKINKNLAGKSIRESNIRQNTGCTLIAINCEDETMQINPPPDTILEQGREIVLIGSFEAEYAFNSKYES